MCLFLMLTLLTIIHQMSRKIDNRDGLFSTGRR
uniref:Uncharacterized protein n=1 Tax=Siphoviridae sp. ctg5k4 TaxID=2826418 RepID=A0A8S5M882_9CAUD|nr:MAG TPA: hypothetical protein [Siphoviridae sp. ctg5k4]